MLYGRYQFHSILEDKALLPPFKGSTFRGVFGVALKRVVCALKRQKCPECLLRTRCVYSIVFEDEAQSAAQDDSKSKPSPPHPFVIEPPLTAETRFQPGSPFDFGLILLGDVNEQLPYFVYAFEQMGTIGVGRRVNGKRASFKLVSITSGGDEIYREETKRLQTGSAEQLRLEPRDRRAAHPSDTTLILETPLRVKFNNQYQQELPFHVLVRAALRRVSTLNARFGDGEPELDYRGLVERAQKVQALDSHLSWCDWERYSNRQERSMLMGGITGRVTYRGDLGEYLPLLQYCEKVHLGKATTFGLGKIRLITEE